MPAAPAVPLAQKSPLKINRNIPVHMAQAAGGEHGQGSLVQGMAFDFFFFILATLIRFEQARNHLTSGP